MYLYTLAKGTLRYTPQSYYFFSTYKRVMRFLFLLSAILFTFVAQSQYYEDFSDCETHFNPTWFASCIEQSIIKTGEQCGVRLSLYADSECSSGSWRTPSFATSETWWQCSFSIDNAATAMGSIDFHLYSSLPRLGEGNGILLRTDIDNRQLCLIAATATSETTIVQTDKNAFSADTREMTITVGQAGGVWHIQCQANGTTVWSHSVKSAITYSSVASGIKINASPPHPSPIITVWQINCGDKTVDDGSPQPGELTFSEIMFDPTPTVGLPDVEWVEVFNPSGRTIELGNCIIASSSRYGIISDLTLEPYAYAVLASDSGTVLLAQNGIDATAVDGMPPLRNGGDTLTISDANGTDVARIVYNPKWVSPPDRHKTDGGWSIECRDMTNPIASFATWGASTDPRGGTPGTENSIACSVEDTLQPRIEWVTLASERDVIVRFNKPMAADIAPTTDANRHAADIYFADAGNQSLRFTLKSKVDSTNTTGINLQQLYCISGYPLPDTTITFAAPQQARYLDVIFNEIMTYVDSTQSKYIEILNNSLHWVDAGTLRICNPDTNGYSNIKSIAAPGTLLAPQQLMVVARDRNLLHTLKGLSPAAIYTEASLPAMASDKGSLAISSGNRTETDRLDYSRRQHHHAITDRHNVALERIAATAPTSDPANWHSASTASGYNTAGWENSQQPASANGNRHFSADKTTISPDNDGVDDYLTITYQMPANGYTLTADIYTRNATLVCRIVDNHLLGTSGTYTWHGTDINGGAVESGIYIILLQATSPHGSTITEKIVVVKI